MIRLSNFFYRMKIHINLQLPFKFQHKKIKNKKMAFGQRGSIFAKMAIFRRFFDENIQTRVARPEIGVRV